MNVIVLVAAHWCHGDRPRPLALMTRPPECHCAYLHVEASSASFPAAFVERRFIRRHLDFHHNFCARLWAGHDVQEAEEGELQRAGPRTRVSGRRHLFPLVKVRQLQDRGLPEQLLRSLQLQNSGLFWRDSAQKLQKGKRPVLAPLLDSNVVYIPSYVVLRFD